jgi:hypothetical protein
MIGIFQAENIAHITENIISLLLLLLLSPLNLKGRRTVTDTVNALTFKQQI